jgi:sialic acid synthase SpsE/sugar phosphate isomerase/epimerase
VIIDSNILPYTVIVEDSIRNALQKIDAALEGMVVCTNFDGIFQGVLTDGDFRRWALHASSIDLDQPVGAIVNQDCITAYVGDSFDKIAMQLNSKIAFVPLLDRQNRLISLVRNRTGRMQLGSYLVGEGHPCFFVAEIGNNHNGSFELACQLIDLAVESGADCAKFQLRDLGALYINKGDANDASEDLGSQYTLDLLNRFQLPNDQLFKVFDYCKSRKIMPMCTPWDLPSLEVLESYGMDAYKVASADFTNHDFLHKLIETGKPLICSTGMATDDEIGESILLLKKSGALFALLHCNSTYPAPFKDVNIKYMEILREQGGCPVGYSSHERGINVVVAAVGMGANIIEKHFTLDRDMEGNDHRVSLLPQEFAAMVEGARQVEMAIGNSGRREVSQGELMNRETLAKSLFMKTSLKPGEIIEAHMLDIRSPGKGLQPNRKQDLVGRRAIRDLKPGDLLYPSDLGFEAQNPRKYNFPQPFGIPVRYHDFNSLATLSNFDFLEFHLSYQDLEEKIENHLTEKTGMDFLVHAPELFRGDHILDLCSFEENYRQCSIENLSKVVDVTRALKKWFVKSKRPGIIVNVGGFTLDKPMEYSIRASCYEMIADSLKELDLDGVEILPQTMPPFPWHFGGQRFHNLFVDPNEIVTFCQKYEFRICLDISHSKLACNFYKWSFEKFVELVGPYVAHLHIADAKGSDGEGLQIGEGELDWVAFGRYLKKYAPNASFIPEIWQGHKNTGAGFWQAFDLLESYLCEKNES